MSDTTTAAKRRGFLKTAAAGADHVLVLGRVEAAGGRPDTSPLVHLRRSGLRY